MELRKGSGVFFSYKSEFRLFSKFHISQFWLCSQNSEFVSRNFDTFLEFWVSILEFTVCKDLPSLVTVAISDKQCRSLFYYVASSCDFSEWQEKVRIEIKVTITLFLSCGENRLLLIVAWKLSADKNRYSLSNIIHRMNGMNTNTAGV